MTRMMRMLLASYSPLAEHELHLPRLPLTALFRPDICRTRLYTQDNVHYWGKGGLGRRQGKKRQQSLA